MSSNINALTKEQLFACLEFDGPKINAVKINKAKNDGQALRYIGYEYQTKLKDYSKALAWYQLAVNQTNADAYNDIGALYHDGLGVSQDYLTAMEYYLKAARGNSSIAMALEWLTRSGMKLEEVKKLNQQGIHLKEEDKKKTIYQLTNETDDIIRQVRMTRESQLKEEVDELKTSECKSTEEIQELKKIKSSNEQENQSLQNELQKQAVLLEQEKQKSGSSTQLTSNLEQRLADKTEIINVYQTFVQSKSSEVNLLNQRYENIEKENQELKRKLKEYQRCSQEPRSLTDNSNSVNDNNNNATTNNTTELDSQTSLNDTSNRSVDNVRVKTETEPANNSSPSCQTGIKKRKVSPNDS